MTPAESEYLTTRELAELLRIKERKVYDLAASGQIPCSRAMGKLLFPRQAVESWLARGSSGMPVNAARRPGVFLGSYEPLLEWALRESGCGLATLLDGSLDGLERFARGEGLAAGLHIHDAASGDWNVAPVAARFGQLPVALVEFAWRERGLVVAPGSEEQFASGLDAIRGRRLAPRQAGAGSQVLLRHLLERAAVADREIAWTDVARTESEAALAVLEGKADAALGLRAMAEQLRLGFVPLLRERYDLLVDRAAWFDEPLQRLTGFCRSAVFRAKAAEFAGYDVSGFGTVHFNGV